MRARVELRRVCLVLDSRAKRWVVPLAVEAEGLEDEAVELRLVVEVSDSPVPWEQSRK